MRKLLQVWSKGFAGAQWSNLRAMVPGTHALATMRGGIVDGECENSSELAPASKRPSLTK